MNFFIQSLGLTPLQLAGMLGLFLALLVVLGFVLVGRRAMPYRRLEVLFTPAEQRFLAALDASCPSGMRVFGKVRIADVLSVTATRKKAFWHYFKQISSKHLDFVIVDRASNRILCAIELDDSSHNQAHRIKRDEFVDAACEAAGLPLIRVPVRRTYDRNALARELHASISSNNT